MASSEPIQGMIFTMTLSWSGRVHALWTIWCSVHCDPGVRTLEKMWHAWLQVKRPEFSFCHELAVSCGQIPGPFLVTMSLSNKRKVWDIILGAKGGLRNNVFHPTVGICCLGSSKLPFSLYSIPDPWLSFRNQSSLTVKLCTNWSTSGSRGIFSRSDRLKHCISPHKVMGCQLNPVKLNSGTFPGIMVKDKLFSAGL